MSVTVRGPGVRSRPAGPAFAENSGMPPVQGSGTRPRLAMALVGLLSALGFAGCSILPFNREPPRPGRTTLVSPLSIVPVQL